MRLEAEAEAEVVVVVVVVGVVDVGSRTTRSPGDSGSPDRHK